MQDQYCYDVPGHFEQVTLSSCTLTPSNVTTVDLRRDSQSRRKWDAELHSGRLSVLSVSLPLRNEPGPLGYEYFRPPYAPPGGTVHPTYEGTYPQAPVSRWVQPVGYDTSQQPSVDPSPWSKYVPLYSTQSTNEPYPLGFRPQQRTDPMTEAWLPFQGPADIRNASGSRGSYLKCSSMHFSALASNRTGCTMIASTSGSLTRTTFSHLLPCRILDWSFPRSQMASRAARVRLEWSTQLATADARPTALFRGRRKAEGAYSM